MRIKITKTLHKHLENECRKAESSGSLDLAVSSTFVSLLDEGLSHANHILQKILQNWEIEKLKEGIIEDTDVEISRKTRNTPEIDNLWRAFQDEFEFFQKAIASQGIAQSNSGNSEQLFNSGHFLLWIVRSKRFVASRKLELYGITETIISDFISQLPADEDYYIDLAILERLSKLGVAQRKLEKNINIGDGDGVEMSLYTREDESDDDSIYDPQTSKTAVMSKIKKRRKTAIEQFCNNLTEAAYNGDIDPVVGREQETERVIQILSRRKKNNPILIGEAGVGKSAIVEGLALRIAAGEVPLQLSGKQLYSLDLASLVAGTKYRGEFEERIKNFIDEINGSDEIILFIDEIHTIAGAGSTSGSLDAANILKPSLARGEIQCIGATTYDEYREHIESDSALERRFQKVNIVPTTAEQTLDILKNIKEQYEEHHGVKYSKEALRACVELTERYLPTRNFPDKAIDALDEAGAKARLSVSQEPETIKKLSMALVAVESQIEEQSLYNRSELQFKAHSLRNRLEEMRGEWQEQMLKEPLSIDREHIEGVVTLMSGVPVENVSKGEQERLTKMESYLSARVIGQDSAVSRVSQSIKRNSTGLGDPSRPMGVFLFVGPTGVGKTLLAKELSKWMFDNENAIIRVDMSEYSEKYNTSRMIGSPPGYIGYSEGGQLTEAVRRQPYSVILLDEIEKAHSDLYNLMLQVFDEGQLTDGSGRKVDFRNTIIIMTSNVGTKEIAERPKTIGYTAMERYDENMDKEYSAALRKQFPIEFLNRIDDIVVFNTLSIEDIENIMKVEMAGLKERAKALGYALKFSDRACRELALMGYQPQYGARSIRRSILRNIEEPLAELIVSGEIEAGDSVRVEWAKNRIELNSKKSVNQR